jgi:hypothetical protein
MSNSEIYLQNDSADSWSPLSFSYISGLNSPATVKKLTSSGDFTSGPSILYGVQASVTGHASIGETININNGSTSTIQFTVTSGASNFDFTPSIGMNFDNKITLATTVGANQGLSVCAVYKG